MHYLETPLPPLGGRPLYTVPYQISALTFWLPEEFHSFEGSRPRWLSTRTAGATAVVLGVGRVLLTLGVLLTTSAEAAQIITGTDKIRFG